MVSPCSATTYCMAAETCCGFHSQRVLPWRAHRFRFGPSKLIRFKWRLAYALKSLMTRSGGTAASNHGTHMIASHRGRQQIPATVHTYLLNRFQYGVATDLVQVIGRLIHALPRKGDTRGIPFQGRRSRYIVCGINGARFTAVEVAAVANKRDQVSHGIEASILTLPNGRGSACSTPSLAVEHPAAGGCRSVVGWRRRLSCWHAESSFFPDWP